MPVKRTQHGQREPITFDRPRLLLVEGGDDEELSVQQLIAENLPVDEWHVHSMGGKDAWTSKLEVILDDDVFRTTGIAIGLVMDADASPQACAQRLQDILSRAGLPTPDAPGTPATDGARTTGYYVLPDGDQSGALEDLLVLATDASRLELADGYLERLEARGTTFRHRSKSRVQAYLAGEGELTKTIPVALQKEVFPRASPAFEDYRQFLRALN